jgi:starch synthase
MKDAVKRAVELYKDTKKWKTLTKAIMDVDFSWDVSAEKYMDLYKDVSNEY